MNTNMACNSKLIADSGLYQKPLDLVAHTLSTVPITGDLSVPGGLTQEDIHTVITVARVENFCRICGIEDDQSNLVYIFGASGIDLEIHRKILFHLHLQVEKDDQLPQQVCNSCICHLNICHQLFEISHAADSKLRQLFLLPQMTEGGDLCLSVPVEIITSLEVLHEENLPGASVQKGEVPTSENKNCINIQEQDSVQSNIELNEEKNNENHENPKSPTKEKGGSPASLLCHVCGKYFKASANLQAHKRTHLDESLKKKHHCSVCSKSFRSHFHLSEHMNYHTGTRPYICPICDKGFHSSAQLRQHTEVHAQDERKHACEVCGVRFNRRSNMQLHLKTHVKDRSFQCRLCGQTFPTLNDMMSHRKSHSQGDIKSRLSLDLVKDKDHMYTCEVCGKVLSDKRSLTTHLELHRQDEAGCGDRYKCGDCGKVLRSRQTLSYHRQSQHSAERRFHCSYCSEGFMTRKLLQAHERTHTGEKPFTCEVCWKGFRSRNNLAQHMLKHKGERNFECNICGKRFFRKGALNVHHRNHTGEKPFICDICGRPFSQKNDMLKHQKRHVLSDGAEKQGTSHIAADPKDSVNVIPIIITNHLFETHIITEDNQKIVITSVEALDDSTDAVPSTIV